MSVRCFFSPCPLITDPHTDKSFKMFSKPKTYPIHLRLGILGGGQLARFLSLKAQEMGFQVRLLCKSESEPAAQVTKDVVLGDLSDEQTKAKFLDQLDVVTFESEFVDATPLLNLPDEIKVFPSVSLMDQIRDRKTQKEWLALGDLPTAENISFKGKSDLVQYFQFNDKKIVLKKRLFGYDGYGTLMIHSKEDLSLIPEDISPKEWIAEEHCPFHRELAVSIARNPSNQFYILPFVETHQKNSKCDWVKGPVRSFKGRSIVSKLKKLMKKSNYVGLLTAELFDTPRGLIINELAPRVHNSGHYSIEGLKVSQFEGHLRAVFDLPLPKKSLGLGRGFAMANLIGSKELPCTEIQLGANPDGFVHWYGKELSRPGRKLGHLTILGTSSDRSLKQVLKWRKTFWQ